MKPIKVEYYLQRKRRQVPFMVSFWGEAIFNSYFQKGTTTNDKTPVPPPIIVITKNLRFKFHNSQSLFVIVVIVFVLFVFTSKINTTSVKNSVEVEVKDIIRILRLKRHHHCIKTFVGVLQTKYPIRVHTKL
uniref:Transmembrane protein n=1 Tax=Glossina brevipalpis TaxID=37001 RepID=A0A1A9WSB9_9MUSC